MSKVRRSCFLGRFLFLTAFGLVPIGLSMGIPIPCRAQPLASQDYGNQDLGGQDMPNPFGQFPGDDDFMPRRGTRTRTARKKLQSATKGTAKNAISTKKTKNAGTKTDTAGNGHVVFSQEIAPILVANCVGCHSENNVGVRRGQLDLTTFEGLMKGSKKRPDEPEIVIAGKPDQSHLVLRIKGAEAPRMPQGAQNRMADVAIAKIEQWVKEGAKLDAGIDPKKPIKSYAASPEQVLRNQTAKLPPRERDKKIEAVGRERWKQANPKLKPELVSDEHFVMFSNLPSDRATSTIKAMEAQYGHLKRLIGSPATDWVEKVSLYVFSNRKDFIEFVRSVESREVDVDVHSSAKLTTPQPYLAVVDPAGGKKEQPAAGSADRGQDEVLKSTARTAPATGPWPVFSPRMSSRPLSHPAVILAGWRRGWALTWRPRSSREVLITANCVKPHSPISIRVGRPEPTSAWGEATRLPRTAFMRSVLRSWKR